MANGFGATIPAMHQVAETLRQAAATLNAAKSQFDGGPAHQIMQKQDAFPDPKITANYGKEVEGLDKALAIVADNAEDLAKVIDASAQNYASADQSGAGGLNG